MLNEIANAESKAIMHFEGTKLYIDRVSNESIRCWILGALKIKRKLKNHPQNDISRFVWLKRITGEING